MKRYRTLDSALREVFGEKTVKLSLDAGFTCPVRDGTRSVGGCLFCGEHAAGDFTTPGGLLEQMTEQYARLSVKWCFQRVIPYFQSHTNTYAPVERLRALYAEALRFPGACGLAVATRPDCLPDEVVRMLQEFARQTFLWIELGLQTTDADIGRAMRCGFSPAEYDDAVDRLHAAGIRVVSHLIAGLPGDTREGFLRTVRHVARQHVWGVKIHMLHVTTDAPLHELWQTSSFPLLDQETYVSWVCDALELLPPDTVIHRLTGDANRRTLVAPLWTADKLRVLSDIDAELLRRGTCQGSSSESFGHSSRSMEYRARS